MAPLPNCRVGPIRPLITRYGVRSEFVLKLEVGRNSPDDRSGIEDSSLWTCQACCLIGLADIRYRCEQPLLDEELPCVADNNSKELCCEHSFRSYSSLTKQPQLLTKESVFWRDFHIMTQLETLGKDTSVRHRHDAVYFEHLEINQAKHPLLAR